MRTPLSLPILFSSGVPTAKGHLPLLPIPLPTPSPPLLLPSTVCRAGVSKVTLSPRKRLCIALGPRYEDTNEDIGRSGRCKGDDFLMSHRAIQAVIETTCLYSHTLLIEKEARLSCELGYNRWCSDTARSEC
ncbi:hypothetical protein Tco_0923815 [Tanacetum coccineum]|uniref:Uncharacterized protein n=1 Tax=Tanacetum coccineum TaxID=301880 RepID=A0ABQ5D209_9ASTR